jgi:hypothetical protein
MKQLRSLITLLYKRIPPDYVLKEWENNYKLKDSVVNRIFNDNTLHYRLHELVPYYSNDEIENIWKRGVDEWSKQAEYGGNNGPRKGEQSIFNLLNYYTSNALLLEKNTPVVQYEHLLGWRKLSLQLGEDLLTCSFAASKDLESNHNRTFFAWSPILGTNNIRLRNLLSKGMAENHFHLYGSSPHFEISWVCLMNQIEGRKKEFDEFRGKKKRYLDPEIQFGNSSNEDLQVLTIKAAYIRLLLFSLLNAEELGFDLKECLRSTNSEVDNKNNHTSSKYENSRCENGNDEKKSNVKEKDWLFDSKTQAILSWSSSFEESLVLYPYVEILQQRINTYQHLCGLNFGDSSDFSRLDYAITKDMGIYKDNANLLLCGERRFLYDCFKAIERGDKLIEPYQDIFYAYLIIKERLRKELIQINDSVGFTNFKLYQDRKAIFIENKKAYMDRMAEMAVHPTLEISM